MAGTSCTAPLQRRSWEGCAPCSLKLWTLRAGMHRTLRCLFQVSHQGFAGLTYDDDVDASCLQHPVGLLEGPSDWST